MKILILTYGSRGDVQPYIALGKGLRDSGHEVTLATSVRFQGFVEQQGLSYGYMNDDMLSILDTDQGKDLLENTSGLFQIIKQTLKLMGQVGPMQKSLLKESWEVSRQVKPDLVIFHPKAYAGPHIAEKLCVPVVLALPFPMMVPTSERPNIGFPDLHIGGWYNRKTYNVVNRLFGLSANKHVKEYRRLHDLPKQKGFDLLHTTDGTAMPVLHAHSRHVIADPSDWPKHVVTTGYWFLDDDKSWQPPLYLTQFLRSGPPPVYIGFGSMAGRNPKRLAAIVVEALQQSNLRGIIATGWGGLNAEDLPETIIQIDQAPHQWLFPQMAAVVHHGGAGTTAAGLRAGKPSVIVPFFGDQPFWGRRIYTLGVGAKPIPQKKLTAATLAAALCEATCNQNIIDAATEIGAKISQEDGVAKAVAFIEELGV